MTFIRKEVFAQEKCLFSQKIPAPIAAIGKIEK